MAAGAERCPFLVPVMADRLWVYPVPAYCRRPEGGIRVPGNQTLARLCTTPAYRVCAGYRTGSERAEGPSG